MAISETLHSFKILFSFYWKITEKELFYFNGGGHLVDQKLVEYLHYSHSLYNHLLGHLPSAVRSESDCKSRDHWFEPRSGHILSLRFGHEKISMTILTLPLIQEKQLSVRVFTGVDKSHWPVRAFTGVDKSHQPVRTFTGVDKSHRPVYFVEMIHFTKQVAQRATIAHLSPMCQGQISFQKTYKWAMETRGPKSNSSELLCLSWLPATLMTIWMS